MQIVSTNVSEAQGAEAGFTVDFHGDGGERVSVVMAQSASGGLTRENALQKAQVLLLQAGSFGATSNKGSSETGSDQEQPSSAVESLIQEQQEKEKGGSNLQEGLEDTFPASDPVSATYTSTPGSEHKH